MDKLTSLIHNFNCNCHKQYTNVSRYLGNRLDDSLKEIEHFFYGDLWINRLKRRLKEEQIKLTEILIDIILGTISELRDDTQFKVFDEPLNVNGISNTDTMIALNVNMNYLKMNDAHINNVIMHEFGHRQYNQPLFKIIIDLNKEIFGKIGNEVVSNTLAEDDYKYFTDHNELRQRIIPILKDMLDNNWTAVEAYEKSPNLILDDIYHIYSKEYIVYLLRNIL